jgi:hypothetical protein
MSGETGLRARQEAAAERHPERRRRAGVECADPLPGALDAAPDRRVEDAAAGHLEAREAGAVEGLGDPQHLAGRHGAGQRLLREQSDRRVDELRHGGIVVPPGRVIPAAGRRRRCYAREM